MTMLTLLLPLILASPVVASGVPLVEIAAPTETKARKVSLKIEYSPLLEQESEASVLDTVSYVRQDGIAALREKHGVEIVDAADAPTIIIALSWIRHDDSVYGVTIQTRRPGQDLLELETFECECIDSGLTKAVLERLPAALEQLEQLELQAVSEPGPGPEPAETEPAITEPPGGEASDRQRRRLGAMGKAGIGLLGGGAAVVVTGAIVFLQGRRPDQPPGWALDEIGRNFKPPGVALMVTGGALLVTGAVLLVLDRRKASKDMAAVLVPAPNGVVVAGRF